MIEIRSQRWLCTRLGTLSAIAPSTPSVFLIILLLQYVIKTGLEVRKSDVLVEGDERATRTKLWASWIYVYLKQNT